MLEDAQTSGGLLLSVPDKYIKEVMKFLNNQNKYETAIIGKFISNQNKNIFITDE